VILEVGGGGIWGECDHDIPADMAGQPLNVLGSWISDQTLPMDPIPSAIASGISNIVAAGSVTTGSATGSFSVSNPKVIAFDSKGDAWITALNPDRLVELSPNGQTIGSFSAGVFPNGIVVDASDNVWVTNYTPNTLTELSSSGTILKTISLPFSRPAIIAKDLLGNFLISYDGSGNWITKVSPSGQILANFLSGSGPYGLAVDQGNNIWVTNRSDNTIWKMSPSGARIFSVGVGSTPYGVVVDPAGDAWVTNYLSNSVSKISNSGSYLGTFSVGAQPWLLAVSPQGNIWIPNSGGSSVMELSPSGTLLKVIPANNPIAVAIDPAGNPWYTDYAAASVVKLAP
jgi:streptogramin lyase